VNPERALWELTDVANSAVEARAVREDGGGGYAAGGYFAENGFVRLCRGAQVVRVDDHQHDLPFPAFVS
jgi:hypothetical protein